MLRHLQLTSLFWLTLYDSKLVQHQKLQELPLIQLWSAGCPKKCPVLPSSLPSPSFTQNHTKRPSVVLPLLTQDNRCTTRSQTMFPLFKLLDTHKAYRHQVTHNMHWQTGMSFYYKNLKFHHNMLVTKYLPNLSQV